MMDLQDKKVTIIGTARSGFAAAQLVKRLNGHVRFSEQKALDQIPNDIRTWAESNAASTEWGRHTHEFIADSDLLVLSPGVRFDASPVQWAQAKGIPVLAEIELAYQCCPCPIIAVTGSNGKTTVVTLIAKILEHAGKNVSLCGNIGYPFAQCVLELRPSDVVVLEVSSFQLETILHFKPHIAVLLNFSENHLDRHKDITEYFDAKRRIFLNQDENDYAVLNGQEERLLRLSKELKAKVVFFNDFHSRSLKNPNFLAAQTVVGLLGVPVEKCDEVFDKFPGVEHRMERVRTLEGVDYINDSKSTTAEAGRWAMQNTQQPLLLICGGRDKNIDFSVLKDLVRQRVKKMLVIGEAREKFVKTFQDIVDVEQCQDLSQAVQRARQCAQPGDCVLLSPMCASYDMFKNFEERGHVFKALVNDLRS
jgi:UDP-N-acetylmuramoylalanine--D-glutamate ligase